VTTEYAPGFESFHRLRQNVQGQLNIRDANQSLQKPIKHMIIKYSRIVEHMHR
jgi:hypothetical protein